MLYWFTMLKYPRIGLTVKSDLERKDDVVDRVIAMLRAEGAQVYADQKHADSFSPEACAKTFASEREIDLLLVMGGDGTILRAVREMKNVSVPILAINRGAVGFLAEMNVDEAADLLPKFLRGEGVIDERSVLHVIAERDKKVVYDGCVLNEAVISQGSIARLMDLRTTVNGEELTTFRADGLIIAPPTGSTAYTLAAGGPIVHPQLQAVILTPINPHTFSQKPIVIPGDHTVEVEVLAKMNKFHDTDVSLTLDGQTYITLKRHDCIRAVLGKETVKFLRRSKETFYGTLRTKLKWGERPED